MKLLGTAGDVPLGLGVPTLLVPPLYADADPLVAASTILWGYKHILALEE